MNISHKEINEVKELYQRLVEAWNERDARSMADRFAEEGESIGYDGSQSVGREEIYAHLKAVFDHHLTAKFVYKVKDVRFLAENVAVVRAIAGMVPDGQAVLNRNVNTHHTIVAAKNNGHWCIHLFQNTPAQFHGRPELVEQMTNELTELI
ncbi:MAG: hypothetical protein K0R75_951 [Paenibacillaceae bacterium]|nr:hypothetical protein [Paenibacillaceae bacterium]